jgi:hypothetical protein
MALFALRFWRHDDNRQRDAGNMRCHSCQPWGQRAIVFGLSSYLGKVWAERGPAIQLRVYAVSFNLRSFTNNSWMRSFLWLY